MQKIARPSRLPWSQRLRAFWCERFVPFWQGIQPLAIALAWGGAGALGYAGFARPSLQTWAELPEQARERYRAEIRELLGLLRSAGFQIYRVGGL